MAPENPALRILRTFPRPQRQLVKQFENVLTGFIVDANDRRGALPFDIRPLVMPCVFAGPAITVQSAPADNLAPWAALEIAQPGDVIVIATGRCDTCSVFGDLLAGMARNCGIAALVTDGVVRDIEGLEELGLPVFARGLSPNSPGKNGPGEIGFPIQLGAVTVCPGDVVVGDRNGVVLVPQSAAEQVIAKLEAIRAKEAAMDASVRQGARLAPWLPDALARLGVEYVD